MNILTTIAQNLQESITRNQIRKARAKAVHSALISMSVRHPEYQGVGFDEALINNQAAELMEPFLSEGTLPNADALADVWATQFQFSTMGTQKAIANIMPMINDFVYILATSDFSTDILYTSSLYRPTIVQPQTMQPSGVSA